MGRRSEQRIAISFPVVVRGQDSRGTPFVVTTTTHDISCTGACLHGLNGIVEPGNKVEIECENQKAWYRVQWVGKSRGSEAGWAGFRCLEPGKYIWGVTPREWEADTYDHMAPQPVVLPPTAAAPPNAEPPRPAGQERRQFPRHACRIEAQVMPQNHSVRLPGTVTDISLGGCYVEMLTPLPAETLVELSLGQKNGPLRITGTVRSSQTGLGMGVVFTGISPDEFEALLRLTAPTEPSATSRPAPAKAHPAASPQPEARAPRVVSRPDPTWESGPIKAPDARETLAAVVRILVRKKLLTRAELLEELERLKPTPT